MFWDFCSNEIAVLCRKLCVSILCDLQLCFCIATSSNITGNFQSTSFDRPPNCFTVQHERSQVMLYVCYKVLWEGYVAGFLSCSWRELGRSISCQLIGDKKIRPMAGSSTGWKKDIIVTCARFLPHCFICINKIKPWISPLSSVLVCETLLWGDVSQGPMSASCCPMVGLSLRCWVTTWKGALGVMQFLPFYPEHRHNWFSRADVLEVRGCVFSWVSNLPQFVFLFFQVRMRFPAS